MPHVKYSPLDTSDVAPPPYDSGLSADDTAGTAAASARHQDAPSVASPVDAPSRSSQSPIKKQLVRMFSKLDFSKSYTFKVQSMVYDQKLFRFEFKPRNGFKKFQRLISEKIHYNLDEDSSADSLAFGYIDKSDLIVIQSDEDLLECIKVGSGKRMGTKKEIYVMVYDSRKHLELQNKIKRTRRLLILGICLVLFIAISPILMKIFGR